MARTIADVVPYDPIFAKLSLRLCLLGNFSDVDSGAKRSVVVCVCKCNIPARQEEIMDLPPSFDPVCLENRVNMSLVMLLPLVCGVHLSRACNFETFQILRLISTCLLLHPNPCSSRVTF